MSLSDDFNLYYRETFIGVEDKDGVISPAFVTNVSSGDFRGRNEQQRYGEEARNHLIFDVVVITKNGGKNKSIRYDSGLLHLELPELGYIDLNGSPVWVRYAPQHVARKGLINRRVIGAPLTNETAIAIYEAIQKQPNHLIRQFHLDEKNGIVFYKGRATGMFKEKRVTLKPAAKYLKFIMNEVFPELEVEVDK